MREAVSTRTPRAWWLVAVLAALISVFAIVYVVFAPNTFPPPLKASFLARPWGIYPHALFGAIALFSGALQFRRGILVRRPRLHRAFGMTYVVSTLVAGSAGTYMAFYSYGGWTTHAAFGLLGVLTLTTTVAGFLAIRRGDVEGHRAWMLRSYALVFGAVLLRAEAPLLSLATGDFDNAYRIVSWLSWLPNLLWAEWYLRRSAPRQAVALAGLGRSVEAPARRAPDLARHVQSPPA